MWILLQAVLWDLLVTLPKYTSLLNNYPTSKSTLAFVLAVPQKIMFIFSVLQMRELFQRMGRKPHLLAFQSCCLSLLLYSQLSLIGLLSTREKSHLRNPKSWLLCSKLTWAPRLPWLWAMCPPTTEVLFQSVFLWAFVFSSDEWSNESDWLS